MLSVHPLDEVGAIACQNTHLRAAPQITLDDWTGGTADIQCGNGLWPSDPTAAVRSLQHPLRDGNDPSDAPAAAFTPTMVAAKSDAARPRSAGSDAAPDDRQTIDASLEVALLSDYRRGGVTRSGGEPALQIALDVEEPSGWSLGIYAATIEERKGANFEVELYGAKSFEFGDTELTLGASALIFPGGEHIDFGIARASLSHPLGPVDLTLAVNYAWEQANLEHEDNLYVVLRGRSPIGRLMGVPLTAGASIGRAEGHMAIEGVKVDWSLSLTADIQGTDIGLSYVDTDLDDERGDPTCVISITRTF